MEGDDGIITTVGSSPPPTSDTEIFTVGSPSEDLGFHEEAAEAEVVVVVPSSAAVSLSSSSSSTVTTSTTTTTTAILTDDLKEKIIRQVEYYFSDENLPTDKFLMKYVRKDKAGFVCFNSNDWLDTFRDEEGDEIKQVLMTVFPRCFSWCGLIVAVLSLWDNSE
ncbi:hypothetical protein FRX31_035381 [Thalictrum thalictroides]|uniref:HTH La-type RNA-binding domain-containing protein n=1 Tax=Thalictrum thalictroides TaxID=46969 RepID=A0A7J6URZ4_THATH|nr:hypothetical protein FRX31_035381 [Thalictrum thalictroides]